MRERITNERGANNDDAATFCPGDDLIGVFGDAEGEYVREVVSRDGNETRAERG